MPIKAGEIVTDALEEIIVQADEAPIEPADGRAGIRMLNDMMYSFAAKGVNLGYTAVSSLGDVITVPLGAVRWMKLQLAIELAPKYDAKITPAMLLKVKDAYKAVLNLSIGKMQMSYPHNLPIGSGNDYPCHSTTPFYPEPDDTILTETGRSIALEDDTEESS